MKKLKYVALGVLIAIIAVWYALPFAAQKVALPNDEQYTVYTSCYPLYVLTSLITNGANGINVKMLTQPIDEGYASYSLSDWDNALLEYADVFVTFGSGFEGYTASYSTDTTIVVSALSGIKLINMADYSCEILDCTGNEDGAGDTVPWPYMSLMGSMDICEAICANMCTIDEDYTAQYLKNLNSAYDTVSSIQNETEKYRFDSSARFAVANDAVLYIVRDAGLEPSMIIRRYCAQDMTQSEIEELAGKLNQNGITVLLCEEQMPKQDQMAFEAAGIKVISFDIALKYTPSNGIDAFFETYRSNMKILSEGMSHE